MDTAKHTNCTINLDEGDEIILYTDGVTECNNPQRDLYGEDRLIIFVEEQRDNNSMDQVNNLISDLHKYMDGAEQFDDITIMAMKVKEKQN